VNRLSRTFPRPKRQGIVSEPAWPLDAQRKVTLSVRNAYLRMDFVSLLNRKFLMHQDGAITVSELQAYGGPVRWAQNLSVGQMLLVHGGQCHKLCRLRH